MKTTKAPYNFVPYSKEVVFPEWANAINHDVPFKDGESGEISITLKTHSPIFIANGNGRASKETGNTFSKSNKGYFIPATTIKGTLRSVLEAMSFSKMDLVQDQQYSVRDFDRGNKFYKKFMENHTDINAGWLYLEDGVYKIDDCGKPGRIPLGWIDEKLRTSFKSINSKSITDKSANAKYLHLASKGLDDTAEYTFSKGRHFGGENYMAGGRRIYDFNPLGETGTIVYTGQPSPRKEQKEDKPSGKILEFIFFNTQKTISVSSSVINNFKFAMFDGEPDESIDWKVRKVQLKGGAKIPVFFRKNNDVVIDMGLSYLYKIVYQNSVKDLLSEYHKSESIDMAESIFGYTNKANALKSRVSISNAFSTNKATVLDERSLVLASPKASYYPNYIKQKKGKVSSYLTFNDSKAELSGRKRYPIHANFVYNNDSSPNISTTFCPLDSGVEFDLKIRFHNLRKIEIGALISAITFHNTANTFHSIGMAKAYGYGKTEFIINSIDGTQYALNDYLGSYESYMNESLNIDWINSPQLLELVAMSSNQANTEDSSLAYMQMDTKGANDFTKAKKDNESLQPYTTLTSIIKPFIKSYSTELLVKEARKLKAIEYNLYANLQNTSSRIAKVIKRKKTKVESVLETHKLDCITKANILLEQVQIALQDAENRLKEKTIAENAAKKKQNADFDLSAIDTTGKNAFKVLTKIVEIYIKHKQLKTLETEFHEQLFEKVLVIFSYEKFKKDKQRTKRIEVLNKKLSQWLGEVRESKFYLN